jgi:hypothetical protein
MSTVINFLIPFSCGVYFLLILKGVVRLSPEKQIKFDEFVKKKKLLFTVLAYLLIFISVISALLELYFAGSA